MTDTLFPAKRRPLHASLFATEDGRLKLVARLKRCHDLISDLKRHRQVSKAISAGHFDTIRRLQAKIGLKYLHPRYLAKNLSTDDKADVFVHHYSTLENRLEGDFLKKLLSQGLSPWSYAGVDGEHRVSLTFSHPTDNEGELTLEYSHRGSAIYLMSFSFAPGSLAGRPNETVVLLTRVQGAKTDFETVRRAMKDLRGLSGASLLMAALQGLTLGMGSTAILGVSAQAQVCLTDGVAAAFVAAYDEFFTGLGGVRHSDEFFLLTAPLVERPLAEVKPNNRSRIRFQRERKQELQEAFRLLFQAATSLQ